MNQNLQSLRNFFSQLAIKDSPFVERFGTKQQLNDWNAGKRVILSTPSKRTLVQTGNRMGSIRDSIHSSFENNTEYRLFYLQHGPQTLQDIEKALGKDVAEAVSRLREDRDVAHDSKDDSKL